MDRACLLSKRSGDILTNPPGGIGTKAIPEAGVKLLDGMHEPEVTLLNEVHEIDAEPLILLRVIQNQAQVGGDQEMLGLPALLRLLGDLETTPSPAFSASLDTLRQT